MQYMLHIAICICDWICKSVHSLHKYKCFEIQFLKYSIHYILRLHVYVAARVQFSINLQSLMVVQSINSTMNSYVDEFPTISDSYFARQSIPQTLSQGWRVGVGVATKWQAFLIQYFNVAKQHRFKLFSAPHITKLMQLNAQSHQAVMLLMYSDSLLAICLSTQDGAIYRPVIHLWMPDRLKKEKQIVVLLAIVHT